ncbi:hypothetical protein Forpi1262_v005541 [Fusarium oxysporum f. sp. raphani]|uniref:Uncharacterized protein n=1 Tax=Fusarium oxysporum f. sp. raphani TaxID=96318 RepID=A0A8J5Q2L9_FUSOX|nr:hypothetical protein Forpi1262_v005541 [Fusarium oxysporum f. sp. raphani]
MGQSPVSSFQTTSRLERLKLGHCYFTASEKRLGAAISRVDTLSIQCLCLAGIYHVYLIRPVQALRLFHAAGVIAPDPPFYQVCCPSLLRPPGPIANNTTAASIR